MLDDMDWDALTAAFEADAKSKGIESDTLAWYAHSIEVKIDSYKIAKMHRDEQRRIDDLDRQSGVQDDSD